MDKDRRQFLEAIRDGADVYPLIKKLGYGWAVQERLVYKHGPENTLDFTITARGIAALTTE